MKSTRVNKRRASAKPKHYKRLRNDAVEIEATDKYVPGDLDFYIDDDGNLETLEIGSIPNVPTVADSPVRPDTPLAVSNLKFCLSFYNFQEFHNSQLHCTLYTVRYYIVHTIFYTRSNRVGINIVGFVIQMEQQNFAIHAFVLSI